VPAGWSAGPVVIGAEPSGSEPAGSVPGPQACPKTSPSVCAIPGRARRTAHRRGRRARGIRTPASLCGSYRSPVSTRR